MSDRICSLCNTKVAVIAFLAHFERDHKDKL